MRISDDIQFGFLVAFLREDHRACVVVCLRTRGAANQTCECYTQSARLRKAWPASSAMKRYLARHADGVAIGPCVPFSKSIIPRRWAADKKSVVVDVLGRYYSDLTARATIASVAFTASSEQMEICGGVRTRAVVVSFSVTFSLQQKRQLRHNVVCEIDRRLGRPASPNDLRSEAR